MRRFYLLAVLVTLSLGCFSQSFEVSGLLESYKGTIGETIKAPVKFRNTSEKPITIIIRKISEQIGSTQRNFFCLDGNCNEDRVDDYVLRVEPGQSVNGLQIALEGGLVPGVSSLRFVAFNKFNPSHAFEFDVNFAVEEKLEKNIYQSKIITVKDVYPNPAVDHAYVDYMLNNDRTKAKVRVHNILGNVVGEYDLSPAETLLRIKTDDLNPGIYFYTLYIDNESVMTRKLIVRK